MHIAEAGTWYLVHMLQDVPGLTGLLVVLAVAPGFASWWRGRALVRLADDPALPERLLAARKQNGAALGAAGVLLMAASPKDLPWTLALLTASVIAGAYPLRRTLFGETWTLAAYSWFAVRLLVAIWGFWLAVAMLPVIVGSAGRFDWLVAMVLGTACTLWYVRYADVLRALLRARPVEDHALLARFHGMVAASGIAMPRFERVDLQGGVVANAIALPSLRGSSVIFTDTLLDRLEPEETVAICAHELAHLEHFNRAYLARLRAVDLSLVVFGAALAPISRAAGLPSYTLPLVLWAFAFLGSMAWRARDRQRNETASDLRAVALCGDAEALIRGLTRLYVMARVPRRLDAAYEQRATHPSLARRIRDIRAAAGTPAASLESAATFRAADGRATAVFEREALQWHEGDAATHVLRYAYLAELRVEVRGSRPASLVALERGGRRWDMPLASGDVVRAQAVLDVVDAQLPPPAAPPSVWPKIRRLVLAFVAVVALTAGQIAMAFVTLLALLQPASPLVAAAGIASLSAGALLMRHAGAASLLIVECALVLAALGFALLYISRSNRDEPMPRRAVAAAVLLGVCAALSVVGVALGGLDPVRLHQSARSATAAPILLMAFAGALAMWRSKAARYAAIPVLIIAAATSAAASGTFLDRFGRDPFLTGPQQSIVWSTVEGAALSELTVPRSIASVELSPGGGALAIVPGEPQDDGPVTFHVGPAQGPLTEVSADALTFLDDEHVLVMVPSGDGVELRQVKAAATGPVLWRTHVADAADADLSIRRVGSTVRWRVMAWNRNRRLVRAEGTVGREDGVRAEWPLSTAAGAWIEYKTASGNHALVVETAYGPGLAQSLDLWRWAWLFQPDREARFRAATGDTVHDVAVSRLDAACFTGVIDESLLCGAFDGTRTRFVSFDPSTRQIAGVAWLDGQFYAPDGSDGEWIAGWHGGGAVVVHPLRRQGIKPPEEPFTRVFQMAAAERAVATVSYNAAGSTVRVYRLGAGRPGR